MNAQQTSISVLPVWKEVKNIIAFISENNAGKLETGPGRGMEASAFLLFLCQGILL